MLLHCAKPGDSGTYRITITNSSGTASCSASLSVRSESQIFFVRRHNYENSPRCPRKDNIVHTNPNSVPPLGAKKPLLQPWEVQLHVLLVLLQRLLLLLLLHLQLLLLLRQRDNSLFVLPLLPLDALSCYSCYLNKAMLTTDTFNSTDRIRIVKKLCNFHDVSSRRTLEGRERPLSDEFTTNCVACQCSESLRVGKTGCW